MARTGSLRKAVVGMLVTLSTACGSTSSNREGPATPREPSGSITVFAASSLTSAFTEIGEAFEAEHPRVSVRFNFAASSELVSQIREGAPADVFASADIATMELLTDADDRVDDTTVFATNVAEIVVAAGNPRRVGGIADLARDDLIVVLCAPEVPCGRYSTRIFDNAGVETAPKSLEDNVKAVVTKVSIGEADAGIVYRTDVLAAGSTVEGVEIPAAVNVVARYPIVLLGDAPNVDSARFFVEYLLSEAGRAILIDHGFGLP
jgi:molybdate transport system substrate-binding protein